MATTFHIPQDLLDIIDERAKARKLSRNRFVVLTLSQAIDNENEWSPQFLEALDDVDKAVAEEADSMFEGIISHRSSKKPASL